MPPSARSTARNPQWLWQARPASTRTPVATPRRLGRPHHHRSCPPMATVAPLNRSPPAQSSRALAPAGPSSTRCTRATPRPPRRRPHPSAPRPPLPPVHLPSDPLRPRRARGALQLQLAQPRRGRCRLHHQGLPQQLRCSDHWQRSGTPQSAGHWRRLQGSRSVRCLRRRRRRSRRAQAQWTLRLPKEQRRVRHMCALRQGRRRPPITRILVRRPPVASSR